MKNENFTYYVIWVLLVLVPGIFFFSGCCPTIRTPASVHADINRLQLYNQRLEGENEYLKDKFAELTGTVEGYAGGVSEIAGESLSDLDRLQHNNNWIGDFIQRILAELSERNNESENTVIMGQD